MQRKRMDRVGWQFSGLVGGSRSRPASTPLLARGRWLPFISAPHQKSLVFWNFGLYLIYQMRTKISKLQLPIKHAFTQIKNTEYLLRAGTAPGPGGYKDGKPVSPTRKGLQPIEMTGKQTNSYGVWWHCCSGVGAKCCRSKEEYQKLSAKRGIVVEVVLKE